jgi:hypothetical protein
MTSLNGRERLGCRTIAVCNGLKKAGMARRADAGYSTQELMADSGHKTLAMVELYTKDANQKRLAASGMAKRTKRDADCY